MSVQGLADKSLAKASLLKLVEADSALIPEVLEGVSSPKAAVRYGCAAVLMELSKKHPERLYPYWDSFVELLSSKHRILVWNGLAIIANLCFVDSEMRFDALFDKYYSFINDPYMVTVANAVANSEQIGSAKPYLASKITSELLKVESIPTTPHLTDECKSVIAEKALQSFSKFYDKLDKSDKEKVAAFAERCSGSSRKSLAESAELLLKQLG
jgi:hypothetical protein